MKQAKHFDTFGGNDYFRDEYGNIYTRIGDEVAFCGNLKRGGLTEDKAEPSYPVNDIELVYDNDSKDCDFCCCYDFEDSGGKAKLYPREGYQFYAGYTKQLDVDEFDEFETEEINFCPICGRKFDERKEKQQ